MVVEGVRPSQLTHNVHEPRVPRSALVTGDLHYGITDRVVEAARVAFARDVKPELAVDVGDFWDNWMMSTFPKSPRRLRDPETQLQTELDLSKPYVNEICSIVDKFHMIPGNHEMRLERAMGREAGFHGLRVLEWPTLAELPKNVTYHGYGAQLWMGPMTFEHGHDMPKGVKKPAQWILDNRSPRNAIHGHTHHMESASKTVFDQHGKPTYYRAFSQGTGIDFAKQDYAHEPNWQHGFSYVEFFKNGGRWDFTVYQIQVVNGKFSWGGKVYDGRKWM